MLNKIIFLLALGSFTTTAYSQNDSNNYISTNAFRKMMSDHYRFTLVGAQSPASGLKVETSKPTITLKGNIIPSSSRGIIFNLELEGGLDNNVMQLISGKKVSSYFKATVGGNFLFSGNKGYYNSLSKTEIEMTRHATKNYQRSLTRQMDTFLVIRVLTDREKFHEFKFERFVDEVYDEIIRYNQLDEYMRLDDRPSDSSKKLLKTLIIAMLTKYGAKTALNNEDSLLNNFRNSMRNISDTTIQTQKMLEDYDRLHDVLVKEKNTFNNRLYDFEIALTKFNWNAKLIRWLNVSLIGANADFWVYDGTSKSLLDTNSLTGGISASYNWFFKWKESHRYIYFRTGAALMKSNNLSDLKKLDYKEESIVTAGNGQLSTKKEGTAYEGTLAKEWGYDIFFEGYFAPIKNASFPGLYIKPTVRHNKAWLNPTKFPVEFGLIWNVNSSDKDAKNILTIVPYVSWANMLKGYNNINKVEKSSFSGFAFNIRFAVPINLGKS